MDDLHSQTECHQRILARVPQVPIEKRRVGKEDGVGDWQHGTEGS